MKTKLIIAALALSALSAFAQVETNVFAKLMDKNDELIMTNAQFRSIAGRKVIFKQLDTDKLKPVDVMQLHPKILAKLKIDTSEAIAKQEEIDKAKGQSSVYYGQQGAIIAEQRRVQAEKNAVIAEQLRKEAAIEAKAQAERNLLNQERQADLDRQRAETARTRAAERALDRIQ